MFLHISRAREQGKYAYMGLWIRYALRKIYYVSKIPPAHTKNQIITVSVFVCTLQLNGLLLKSFRLLLHCYTLVSCLVSCVMCLESCRVSCLVLAWQDTKQDTRHDTRHSTVSGLVSCLVSSLVLACHSRHIHTHTHIFFLEKHGEWSATRAIGWLRLVGSLKL